MTEQTQWALFHDWGRWQLLPVQRRTEKTVFALEGSRVRHLMAVNVRAIGPEDKLRRALERLTSSEALYGDDTRKAGLRRNERNAAILAGLVESTQ